MKAGRSMRWLGLIGGMWLLAAEVLAQEAPRPPMRERGAGMQRMMPDARPPHFLPDDKMPHRHRMTVEERRQLRRDVHQAGQELYPPRLRERRREFRGDE